ncbi:TPA: UDP-2,4-diacetamido-2,4,6-trideoxy-beta-L-altropyranose hydrolase [Pseudomonas aeruginosa]|uniref:UDP-2,4-diacetamido-2,4, 6-trideoxy-beta-L-altropyranose hydrolase n=1 Tax=Pseudomonas aeruginosa TaxID=287 RepID=UPI00093D36E3|nr:UDP-2,4-diacetamido-2,4,6-trideoxy-beta-L-altropyranose hydrolase [Pseudomonas aeruginosa]HEJ1615562.1 UDP-2,4-diacetamido-2,4,6-trideoxy-beta-L-altropyranose hydrolase [Pseudomonas aeruginosa]HEJ4891901.1 UDP-2,4-diacetamido-2,4,6-trideoxy-beta-L-altropyranose hydrolase [Pseudomonas aeruginosa]HEJ5514894.1 UDP-2,4-diacetamido-2,4,6-trideoxy-beta-L-altropyranose hydrolase [Pseudomonas aeruginosa]HEK1341040.1 UDP-2,4-diacetamido-2,4,6-trideoxy-beta-L-altropyranose hydrolase [Pseudomonas aerug
MKVAFRVDASLDIGNGHVMRCLTLASYLRELGGESLFICRDHPGNLISLISDKGFSVNILPVEPFTPTSEDGYESWLGATQERDSEVCKKILREFSPDWLVVDHYGLGARWEISVKPFFKYLFVIDDLANRPHVCDVLLDQNLGRKVCDYLGLVPTGCRLLVGVRYALLRPEFPKLRDFSLQRRRQPCVNKLLVTMGGVDQPNATGLVLHALLGSSLPEDCQVSVIMGANAPWLEKVKLEAARLPWQVEVSVNVDDMAQRMASSDLIIGAAGSTSWERCCLGVPSILVVLAENQRIAASALRDCGAVKLLDIKNDFEENLRMELRTLLTDLESLKGLSAGSAAVTDGGGGELIAELMKMYSHAGGVA